MTAHDLAQRIADALSGLPIPAAAVLSISTTTGASGSTQIHILSRDADAIADAIGDRSQEVVTHLIEVGLLSATAVRERGGFNGWARPAARLLGPAVVSLPRPPVPCTRPRTCCCQTRGPARCYILLSVSSQHGGE